MKNIFYLLKYFYYINLYSVLILFRKKESFVLKDTIVCLTSFNNRINNRLVLVLKSILTQSVNVDRVILFVSKNDIDRLYIVENKLRYFSNFQIEIVDDYLSYKKIICPIKSYSDFNLIIIDDDIFFPRDFIERIMSHYNSKKLTVNWGHKCTFQNRKLNRYSDFLFRTRVAGKFIIPNTGSGLLIPKNLFHFDDFDLEIIFKYFERVDDMYIFYLSILKSIQIQVLNHDITELYDPRISNLNLNIINSQNNNNDKAIDYINSNFDFDES